jgi:MFS transporter, MHS family, proline/betaine transporter
MTINTSKTQNSLTREQKEAVGLLSIGTFLEYFDLMLYVHMAVLLNELFFPKTDPFTASLISAFSFCSTYLLRPLGAFIFGYIGDKLGRKQTIIITTFMMALSSLTMFLLPTYAQIGISATWIITICRMVQGMSSMGEVIGASIYLTELIKPPKNYAPVAFIRVMSVFGTFAALLVGLITVKLGFNWRYAFLFGAGIALIGTVARSSLRETPEFVNAKNKFILKNTCNLDIKVNKKIAISYFFLEWGWPMWVYVTYIHYGVLLKNNFGYSAADVIQHNLYTSIVGMIAALIIVYSVTKIHPMQVLKIRSIIFALFLPFFIVFLEFNQTILSITILQIFIKIFNPISVPADAITFKYFPVLKRFFSASMLFALSRALMYLITSFGTVYVTFYFGSYGLFIIIIPILFGYFYGLNTFINLEKEAGNYPKKTFWSIVFLDNLRFREK